MRIQNLFLLKVFVALIFSGALHDAFLPPEAAAARDSTCHIWVYFKDKAGSIALPVNIRSQKRRIAAGYAAESEADIPVSGAYLAALQQLGAVCRNTYAWGNAASFSVPCSLVAKISAMPFVKTIRPVASLVTSVEPQQDNPLTKVQAGSSLYGASLAQLQLLNIPAAHRYIKSKFNQVPGDSLLIGFFDSGFWLKHRCFSDLIARGGIVADSDFVEHDTSVADADSVRANVSHPFYKGEEHGTLTFSLVAASDSNLYMGGAWGARFVLAKTEDVLLETHIEEDNWAAAVVWAEGLGVDIVSSSLGYRFDFTDGSDYLIGAISGDSTFISKAAQRASELGMLIVNAVGNDGGRGIQTVSVPADVEKVISVGGVNSNRTVWSGGSRGPTADGRIKPDVVALSTGVFVPAAYVPPYTSYEVSRYSGTSYATPVVAGAVALIKQAHPGMSPDSIRSRLYKFCSYTVNQLFRDNNAGWGIPDIMLSCMADSEVCVFAVDSMTSEPIEGVTLQNSVGGYLGATDRSGIAIIRRAGSALPFKMFSAQQRFLPRTLSVDSLPWYAELRLSFKYALSVQVRSEGQAIFGASVRCENLTNGSYSILPIGTGGDTTFYLQDSGSYILSVTAPGFFSGDPDTVLILGRITHKNISLVKQNTWSFAAYPNVANPRRDPVIRLRLTSGDGASSLYVIEVRSVVGKIIWAETGTIGAGTQKSTGWNYAQSSPRILPGVYYLLCRFGGKIFYRKILIQG